MRRLLRSPPDDVNKCIPIQIGTMCLFLAMEVIIVAVHVPPGASVRTNELMD